MSQISRLYDFQAGKKAVSAQVDAEFDQLVAGHNDHDTKINNTYDKLSVDTKITQAMLGNPPLGGVTMPMLASDVQNRLNQIYSTEREVANLKAISSIANRVDSASGIFYDLMDGLNGGSIGKIDKTSTNSTGTIAASASSVVVPVKSTTGFAVGQEVTIFDDVNLERRVITAISAGVSLTFAAMTNSYKAQAQICRSSVVQDTVNKLLKFGGWSYQASQTAASTVVASAYDTSGNGGRKVTVLSNGWLVAAAFNGTTQIVFEVSKDNGATFTQLCSITISASPQGLAIASSGTNVSVLTTTAAGTSASFYKFDATVVTNTAQTALSSPLSGQSSFGAGCSLAIDGNGVFKIVATTKNTTCPNSFNPIAQKSADGVTWTKMDGTTGFDQITTNNATGTDVTNPCIVVRSNNNPVIVAQSTPTTAYAILAWAYNGTSWTASAGITIYAGATFAQANPCAAIAPNGRIWCVWVGKDATDTAVSNVRIKYSDDGGATWVNGGVSAEKLTSGNTYNQQPPVVSIDKNGKVYVEWIGLFDATYAYNNLIRCIYDGTAWGTKSYLTALTTGSALSPSSVDNNTLDFTDPICVYMDQQTPASVKFRGTWVATVATPVLVEDVRYNIAPANNISSAVAWVDRETDAGLSLAATLSIHSATEAYSAMTKTTATVDGTTSEDQFVGSGTANIKATVRLTMTRTSTSVNKGIKSVMGAVGA